MRIVSLSLTYLLDVTCIILITPFKGCNLITCRYIGRDASLSNSVQASSGRVMLVGGSLSQAAPAGPATNAIHIMQLFQSGSCTLTEDNLAANTVTLWRYIMETRTRERRTVSSKMKSEGEGVREQGRERVCSGYGARRSRRD